MKNNLVQMSDYRPQPLPVKPEDYDLDDFTAPVEPRGKKLIEQFLADQQRAERLESFRIDPLHIVGGVFCMLAYLATSYLSMLPVNNCQAKGGELLGNRCYTKASVLELREVKD